MNAGRQVHRESPNCDKWIVRHHHHHHQESIFSRLTDPTTPYYCEIKNSFKISLFEQEEMMMAKMVKDDQDDDNQVQ